MCLYIHRIQNRKYYLYGRFESGTSEEYIAVISGLERGDFSVECVILQTLNTEWKKSLGDDRGSFMGNDAIRWQTLRYGL